MSGSTAAEVLNHRYDAQAHSEVVARLGVLQGEYTEVTNRLREMTETDHVPAANEDRERANLLTRLTTVESEMRVVDRERSRMQEMVPTGRKREPSMMERFVTHGMKGLGTDEAKGRAWAGKPPTSGKDTAFNNLPPEFFEGAVIPKMYNPSDVEWMLVEPENIMRSDESPGGQDWTPVTVYPSLEFADALDVPGGMLDAASSFASNSGSPVKFPVLNDTGEEGEYFVNQASTASNQDVVQDMVEVKTQIINSKKAVASLALEEDAPFDMSRVILNRLRIRIERGTNKAMTTGAGTNDTPKGAVLNCIKGMDTSTTGTLLADDVMAFMDTVNDAYMGDRSPGGLATRTGGAAFRGFMFSQAVRGVVRRMKGTDGHFLWQPMAGGLPPTIGGRGYRINDHMSASVATNERIMMYGNFGYYMYRRVGPMILARFFDSNTVAGYAAHFIGFERNGGSPIGGLPVVTTPTTEAFKYLNVK